MQQQTAHLRKQLNLRIILQYFKPETVTTKTGLTQHTALAAAWRKPYKSKSNKSYL